MMTQTAKPMIEIRCVNNDTKFLVPAGINLKQVIGFTSLQDNKTILGAYVNNKVKSLNYKLYFPKTIEFFDIHSSNGLKMYAVSLIMLMYKASKSLYPKCEMEVQHSMNDGYYVELNGVEDDREKVASLVKQKMLSYVDQDIPFEKRLYTSEEAAKLFERVGLKAKAKLIRSRQKFYTNVDILDDTVNTLFSEMLPSTSYLQIFDIKPYEKGFILFLPDNDKDYKEPGIITDQTKLFTIFQEHKHWVKALGTPYVPDLNAKVQRGEENELIQISEALHEKKYASIADEIYKRKDDVRFIFLAGPSSSGKTTSCRRIATQLSVLGIKPIQISLDDYFHNREDTPKDEKGNYDFECLEALDLAYFNAQMQELLKGNEVELPKFDFVKGERNKSNHKIRIEENSMVIIEGIHGLNPQLSADIARKNKYFVFVSALTQLSLDNHNLISTSDNRLIRRIVRDHNYRGSSAERTLLMWQSVRNGEEKHIFPYQENADSIFNSSLLYEMGVLKTYCSPLLMQVPQTSKAYASARRLHEFLQNFVDIGSNFIPPTSIMKEFLGGSSFSY